SHHCSEHTHAMVERAFEPYITADVHEMMRELRRMQQHRERSLNAAAAFRDFVCNHLILRRQLLLARDRCKSRHIVLREMVLFSTKSGGSSMRFGLFGGAQAGSAASDGPGQGFHDYISFHIEAEELCYRATLCAEHSLVRPARRNRRAHRGVQSRGGSARPHLRSDER